MQADFSAVSDKKPKFFKKFSASAPNTPFLIKSFIFEALLIHFYFMF
jgi:hypothetical protein